MKETYSSIKRLIFVVIVGWAIIVGFVFLALFIMWLLKNYAGSG